MFKAGIACSGNVVLIDIIEADLSFLTMTVVCVFRCESVGGHRERPVAVGPQWSGQSLLSHQPKTLPTDGRTGGAQCTHHYIRYILYTKHFTTTDSILIFVLANE